MRLISSEAESRGVRRRQAKSFMRRGGRPGAVTQSIGDQQPDAAGKTVDAPGVPADYFSRLWANRPRRFQTPAAPRPAPAVWTESPAPRPAKRCPLRPWYIDVRKAESRPMAPRPVPGLPAVE